MLQLSLNNKNYLPNQFLDNFRPTDSIFIVIHYTAFVFIPVVQNYFYCHKNFIVPILTLTDKKSTKNYNNIYHDKTGKSLSRDITEAISILVKIRLEEEQMEVRLDKDTYLMYISWE